MIVLRLSGLKLGYDGKTVIDGASLAVESGDFVCVVGANGSGKSTLIKGILGLIKPLAGEVIYGEGVSQTTIGYLPQEARLEANFPATVKEVVMSGTLGRMGLKPFYGKAEHDLARQSMKTLKIEGLADQSFVDLSGGQKQKVLLARSLAATSKILILDEPSNNLDQTSRKEFYKILKRLNRDSGLTILMITHDLDAEDLIGNKVAAIKNGRVSMYETKAYLESYR